MTRVTFDTRCRVVFAIAAVTAIVFAFVAGARADADPPPAIWDQIRPGMRVDDATALLRPTHAHASMTVADQGGTKKFWPLDRDSTTDIERYYFPKGHVLIVHFDGNGIVTEIEREFVTEQAYQESLEALKNRQ